MSKERNVDLSITTGTHGILELPDTRGNPMSIFLDYASTPKRITVPKIFYNIVVDETNLEGVVIIGK